MTRVIHSPEGLPDWLRRGSGSYPVPEGLTISEVQRILEVHRYIEHRCDEVPVPEGAELCGSAS